jgi:hypothetical protein
MSAFDDLKFEPMYVVHIEGRQNGLFRAHKGRRLITAHRKAGDTPFVAGSRMNNSITDFADTRPLFPGGWVTLIYNGDGGTGHAKYQPAPFSASDDVIALEPLSGEASEPALLLIASLLTQQCVPKFGFGYKLTLHRLGRQKIMVPVTSDADGEQVTDWVGMKRLGEKLFADALARVRVIRRTRAGDDEGLPELTFEPMLITDVFDSLGASSAWYDKNKIARGPGAYPYISRSGVSNGHESIVGRQSAPPNDGNAITIGVDTQTVFYQPSAFYTSVKIQVLRHPKLSADNGPMLVALLREQMGKFQWGNGASLERLKATRIMVPVIMDAGGNCVVDWDGMNRYGRALVVRTERALDSVMNASSGDVG